VRVRCTRVHREARAATTDQTLDIFPRSGPKRRDDFTERSAISVDRACSDNHGSTQVPAAGSPSQARGFGATGRRTCSVHARRNRTTTYPTKRMIIELVIGVVCAAVVGLVYAYMI
jgi:hypothetical protein